MKIEVDARGEACPRPVIMTKKELDKMGEGESLVEIGRAHV